MLQCFDAVETEEVFTATKVLTVEDVHFIIMWRQRKQAQIRQERKEQRFQPRGRGHRGGGGDRGGHRGGGRGRGEGPWQDGHGRGRGIGGAPHYHPYSHPTPEYHGSTWQNGSHLPPGPPGPPGPSLGPAGTGDAFDREVPSRRPWETGGLHRETRLRDKLKKQAADSEWADDYDLYRKQRAKVHFMELELMAQYFRSHPSAEGFWLPLLAMEAARKPHFCDVCDVRFSREGDLIRHEDEDHVVCDLEGCKHIANREDLIEHVRIVHASGLYARTMIGASKEEVQKWRDDRKKAYPTLKAAEARVAKQREKERQREMAYQRYLEESAERKEEYRRLRTERKDAKASAKAKGPTKAMRTRQRKRTRMKEKEAMGVKVGVRSVPAAFSDDSEPEDTCQGIRAFRGTKVQVSQDPETEGEEEEGIAKVAGFDISDDDFGTARIFEANGDDVDDDGDGDDDGPPEEVSTVTSRQRDDDANPVAPLETVVVQVEAAAKKDRRSLSPSPEPGCPSPPPPPRTRSPCPTLVCGTPLPIKVAKVPKRPPTLLEKLLAGEIREERSELLQCVKYICENNFFDDK